MESFIANLKTKGIIHFKENESTTSIHENDCELIVSKKPSQTIYISKKKLDYFDLPIMWKDFYLLNSKKTRFSYKYFLEIKKNGKHEMIYRRSSLKKIKALSQNMEEFYFPFWQKLQQALFYYTYKSKISTSLWFLHFLKDENINLETFEKNCLELIKDIPKVSTKNDTVEWVIFYKNIWRDLNTDLLNEITKTLE